MSKDWDRHYEGREIDVGVELECLSLPEGNDIDKICEAGSAPLLRRVIQKAVNSDSIKDIMVVLDYISPRKGGGSKDDPVHMVMEHVLSSIDGGTKGLPSHHKVIDIPAMEVLDGVDS